MSTPRSSRAAVSRLGMPGGRAQSPIQLGLILASLIQASLGCVVPRREPDEERAALSPLCVDYCREVMQQCRGADQQYLDEEACTDLCRFLPQQAGSTDDDSNTLGCRIGRLEALRTNIEDRSALCQAAGPSGGQAPFACGSACEAYCTLRGGVCGAFSGARGVDGESYPTAEDCQQKCQVLRSEPERSLTSQEGDADTLQCRMYQLSRAASPESDARDRYCPSSTISPLRSSDDPSRCSEAPSCEVYCDIVTRACVADFEVYESRESCLAACATLPVGQSSDTGAAAGEAQNTVGCRIYHAYNAVTESAAVHCSHAGPTGDGHCSPDNCGAFCRMLAQGCPATFAERFDGTAASEEAQASCREACLELPDAARNGFGGATPPMGAPDGSRYATSTPPTGPTLKCRTFHVVEALQRPDDEAACRAAFGGDSCE